MSRRFLDRRDAGLRLAEATVPLAEESPVVLALPRGGVPVAYEVARVLHAPLDVLVVRKLGLPMQPELGMGAIGEDHVCVLDAARVRSARITSDELAAVIARERRELERRVACYRGDRAMIPLQDRTVLLVDDGIATGASMRAAVAIAREHGGGRMVIAVPVAAPDTVATLRPLVDDIVTIATPSPFVAVGQWYDAFVPTTDAEVRALLERHRSA